MASLTFHLIANAHLDPVWLWDWREGLNEGITTSRTVLDLMDEFPELTCIRGEAVIYDHIERYDPETFRRIQKRVAEGRWDIVGGTWLQADTNLPATETLCRHFEAGKAYFRSRFGKTPEIAWAADSFGHSAGLPEILTASGMKGIAFFRTGGVVPPKPAFWWESPSGARVLAYRPAAGWYGCDRQEMPKRLDNFLASSLKCDLENVGVFYGMGDHGGGPTRKMLRDIKAWQAEHPEVTVVHSGLHRLFAALFREASRKGDALFPLHRGELNFCLRGCYSSVAKFKYAYRKTEALVSRAETSSVLIWTAAGKTPAPLDEAWKALLFNSFHDILPGSSIERAYEDQLAWLGQGMHLARVAEHDALRLLASRVDTRRSRPPEKDMPGSMVFLVWNPHPWKYEGPLELEASLDYRPVWEFKGRAEKVPVEVRDASGRAIPFQRIHTEHSSMPQLPWRFRAAINASLPSWGWSVYEIAWRKDAEVPRMKTGVKRAGRRGISNGIYSISARPGGAGVKISRKGKPIFQGKGLHAVTMEDPWGSWGGMSEEPESLDLSRVRRTWKIKASEVLESGPQRAVLAVRMAGGKSSMDLRFILWADRDAVDVDVRLLWDERSARLKLVMPIKAEQAVFEVPGGTARRSPCGEVPGGRFVRAGSFGFCSDALYNFDLTRGALRTTLARAGRYADDRRLAPDQDPWSPAVDRGELKCRIVMTADKHADLEKLSQELEMPPVAETVESKKGSLPRTGSLGRLTPSGLKLLALKPAESGKGVVVRLQETAGKKTRAFLEMNGKKLPLGPVAPYRIVTVCLPGLP